ncbi:MAG TPA: ribonuclease III [Ruminococcaceae bacterium]|nr:ribonuclease III [Oscillospiraceae bacterium]
MGDTVFDLLVRGNLVMQANRPVGKLHPLAATKVCAAAQARDARDIAPLLTEREADIYRRGRNAHTGRIPKSASSAEYHSATGLEALFGWLYLSGRDDRIEELFEHIINMEKYDEVKR